MGKPVVAIVGRPNVGKSTIFNRLLGERFSIVEDKPGITRDRIFGTAEWNGRSFGVIDTGGIELAEDEMLKSIKIQAELAIDEADLIVFMTDGKSGVTAADRDVADMLYRSKKEVVLTVNKIDNLERLDNVYEFYELGFGEPIAISGAHGLGIGDLLDRVTELLPRTDDTEYDEDTVKISVIGRPNVGKSSLVNAVLGEERVIVSPVAGTTRDAVDTLFQKDGQTYVMIDTAGIRKRGKVYETTEKYSVMRAMKAIERSDVVLIVINAEEGIIEQDKHIAGYAEEAGRACVFVVNKWDALDKDDKTMQHFTRMVREHFQFMPYAPILFLSAKTGQRVHRVLPMVDRVADRHAMRVQTHVLNDVLSDAVAMNPPPTSKGRVLRVKYGTQVGVKPPRFVLFVNEPALMHFSYERYLENKFRDAFDFEGTPIRIQLRKNNETE